MLGWSAMEQTPRESLARSAMVLLPAVVATAVFAGTLRGGFVYDDEWWLPRLPEALPSLGALLRDPRGLTLVSHILDRQLWGDLAAGFHLTNVLLHALASALVAKTAARLARDRRVGLLSGLLFAVHPVHVEVVASFANRKDSLAMIFTCLTLLAWHSSRRPYLSYPVALLCYGLGLFAKEVAIAALPLMLFSADLFGLTGGPAGRGRWRRAMFRLLPFLVGGLIAGAMVAGKVPRLFTPSSIQEIFGAGAGSYRQVLLQIAAAVPGNVRLLCVPLRLAPDYPISSQPLMLADPDVRVGLSLLACWLLAIVWLLLRRARLYAFAMIWPPVMFLPCSNLVPLVHFFLAERCLYVPSFGICLLLALGFDWLLGTSGERPAALRVVIRVAATAFLLSVLALAAARSMSYARVWREPVTLAQAAIETRPESWRFHRRLATHHHAHGRYRQAALHLEQAGQHGLYWTAEYLEVFAESLLLSGQPERAEDICLTVVRAKAQRSGCYVLLAQIYQQRGEPRRAARQYLKGLERNPKHARARCLLGHMLATTSVPDLRDPAKGLELCRQAVRSLHSPDPVLYRMLAEIHDANGDLERAHEWSWKAQRLRRRYRR